MPLLVESESELSDQNPPVSDEELMERVQAHNSEAFAQLYKRYIRRAIGHARRRLWGYPNHVEDVVQESFLSVWRSADTFRSGAKFSAWFFTILEHSVFDFLRCPPDKVTDDIDKKIEKLGTSWKPDDQSEHGTEVPKEWGIRALEVWSAELNSNQHNVVDLIIIQKLSTREAARRLGRNDKTVGECLDGACRGLRVHLAKSSLGRAVLAEYHTWEDGGANSVVAFRSLYSLLFQGRQS